MGRRSRRRRSEAGSNANLLGSLADLLSRPLSVDLRPVEDRRTWHPLGEDRPTRTTSGHPTRPNMVAGATSPGRGRLPAQIKFADPGRTVVCVRRHQRKEVLFALKKTGKGSRSPKRRNPNSEISCK